MVVPIYLCAHIFPKGVKDPVCVWCGVPKSVLGKEVNPHV